MEVTDIWDVHVEAESSEEAEQKAELLYENDLFQGVADIRDTTHEIYAVKGPGEYFAEEEPTA